MPGAHRRGLSKIVVTARSHRVRIEYFERELLVTDVEETSQKELQSYFQKTFFDIALRERVIQETDPI